MIRASDGNAPPPVSATRPSPPRWTILAVLCVSLLVVSLDTTILNVAVPDIVRSLHAASSDLQWAIDAYGVVFAGLLLVLGNLGDRLGRKWILLTGILVFGLGSAASAFSGSPDRLIAARAFMGIGAAAVMPATLSILTNVTSRPRLAREPSASGPAPPVSVWPSGRSSAAGSWPTTGGDRCSS